MDENIIRTDNVPLLDELVYQVKRIMLSSVVKDQRKADKYENKDSLKNFNIYRACVEGRSTYDIFTYTQNILLSVGIPQSQINDCLNDVKNIPEQYRDTLNTLMTNYYLTNYVEMNNYYRMLNGLPDYGDEGVYLNSSYTDLKTVKFDLPVHKQSADTINYLYYLGVIDKLIADYPNNKYLNYMGARSIDIYQARMAFRFALLYTTTDAIDDKVLARYKERYDTNRDYTVREIYSEAYKFGSDYYDNFIMVLITVQTFIDMMADLPDYFIKMELFDLRTIKLVFQSYGIDYFSDIPLRYQLSMVKNINRLISYNATTQNIIDICSLFGFDDIKVFKYYLLKTRSRDDDGKYVYKYDGDGNEDLEAMYDLKFLKVPIDGIADNYLHDTSKLYDYDSVTAGDKYWDGDLEHNYLKNKIMQDEFNCRTSEYISIETIYSMTELSFQLSYFYNMMFNDDMLEENLLVNVPAIDANVSFRLTDILCYLFALGYMYNNLSDDIMDTTSKVLAVRGFNFKVNMDELNSHIIEQGFTMEELGVSDFQIPKDQILSYNQLINIFTKNKAIYDHIVDQMDKADDYKIYKIYSDIYDALMVMDFNTKFFTKSDGTIAKTYTDFISDRDSILYNNIMYITSIKNPTTKMETITDFMIKTCTAVQYKLDTDDFRYIFNKLPVVSAEAVKYYIYEVINFFKSLRLEILAINTVYVFDDKLDTKINIIDEILLTHVYTWKSVINIREQLLNNTSLTKEDRFELREELYREVSYILDKYWKDNIDVREELINRISLTFGSTLNIRERLRFRRYITR